MKYTWYMFKSEKPIESCQNCPVCGSFYNCRINKDSFDYIDMIAQFSNCPLIKIEGRVEE